MTSNGVRRKVCVVVTARPSYSRVRSVLAALQDRPDVEMQLVITASALLDRYGNVSTVIEDDGFPITAKVYSIVEGETLVTSAKSTGLGVVELSSVFDALRPDVVVTIADRFETLATAVAASYTNIPVAHLQGGEVTGSIDEKVRHAVTKLADLHFPSTKLAAENLVRLGEVTRSDLLHGLPFDRHRGPDPRQRRGRILRSLRGLRRRRRQVLARRGFHHRHAAPGHDRVRERDHADRPRRSKPSAGSAFRPSGSGRISMPAPTPSRR